MSAVTRNVCCGSNTRSRIWGSFPGDLTRVQLPADDLGVDQAVADIQPGLVARDGGALAGVLHRERDHVVLHRHGIDHQVRRLGRLGLGPERPFRARHRIAGRVTGPHEK